MTSFICCFNCTATKREDGDEKLFVCSACKVVAYCSSSCQKKHWKDFHKKSCKNIWQSKDMTTDYLGIITYWILRRDKNRAEGAYCTDGSRSAVPRPGVYEGEFYEFDPAMTPHRDGFGRYIWSKNMWYVGGWNRDRRHGKGKHLMSCGDIYVSSYCSDLFLLPQTMRELLFKLCITLCNDRMEIGFMIACMEKEHVYLLTAFDTRVNFAKTFCTERVK